MTPPPSRLCNREGADCFPHFLKRVGLNGIILSIETFFMGTGSICTVLLNVFRLYRIDCPAADAEVLIGQLFDGDGEKLLGNIHDLRSGLRQPADQLCLLSI